MNEVKRDFFAINMVGQRWGMLTVLRRNGSIRNQAQFDCLCDCGRETTTTGSSLRTGNTKSCGCLAKLLCQTRDYSYIRTHGMTSTPTWDTWQSMIARCTRPTHKSYHHYGGSGIEVCKRWYSFEAFLEDMGTRPDGMTLDRIDGKEGYTLKNCRWATPKTQARNRKNNRFLTAFGETKLMVEWADDPRCAPSYVTLAKRNEMGWSDERAITEPVHPNGKPGARKPPRYVYKSIDENYGPNKDNREE